MSIYTHVIFLLTSKIGLVLASFLLDNGIFPLEDISWNRPEFEHRVSSRGQATISGKPASRASWSLSSSSCCPVAF